MGLRTSWSSLLYTQKVLSSIKVGEAYNTPVVPNSGPVDPLGVHEGLAGGPRVMIIFFFLYFFFKISKYHLVLVTRVTTRLTSEFKAYFDGVEPAYYPWYKDPFGAVVDDEMEEAEELLMLRESAVAKAEFRKLSLSEFWLQQQDTYPRLCNKAAQMFLPFPTTYLCEAGFSVMFDLKPKKRNRLEMSSDMRLACSETKPNILKLVADCKEQVSH